jgi:hypothetical protein
VSVDPDDATETRRFLLPIKSNLSPNRCGLAYSIVPKVVGELGELPTIAWERDPVCGADLDRLLGGDDAAKDAGAEARGAAELFLKLCLADGPEPADNILAEARRAEIAERTLRRAKASLGVKSVRTSEGVWEWTL